MLSFQCINTSIFESVLTAYFLRFKVLEVIWPKLPCFECLQAAWFGLSFLLLLLLCYSLTQPDLSSSPSPSQHHILLFLSLIWPIICVSATPYPNSFKCFTCEQASDNYSCNRWAEDKWCPQSKCLIFILRDKVFSEKYCVLLVSKKFTCIFFYAV